MSDDDNAPSLRVSVGPLSELADDRCRSIADGRAMVVLTADGPRAYLNRCAHAGERLDRGWVVDGVLSCPFHFWRFDLRTGRVAGRPKGEVALLSLPTEVVGGEVFVTVPGPEPTLSIREQQLRHARRWRRDGSTDGGAGESGFAR